ncbi:ABC transporter permease subunit [Mesorhizobium sp.]|uniref:ABC transporter permease n=1 Tax=Mesorhizobium sp. TaxID=1871066 RepID=UPI00120DA14D|nr:ABC transporter permease subunit [Mesorhizobium sp.]TIL38121.1 MAG: ABC transporter permease subunit [Mesorhizobium sp.]
MNQRIKPRSLLLIPAIAVYSLLLGLPIAMALLESFRQFEPGRIGSVEGAPFTAQNYIDIARPVYVNYFMQTYVLSLAAAIITVMVAFPMAYLVARYFSPTAKKLAISVAVGLLFFSSLVRIYAIQLTFGTGGIAEPVMSWMGVNSIGTWYIYFLIIAGLCHYEIPTAVLMLFGTVNNLNPRLNEAAQSLGATVSSAHLTITLPLCVRGIVAVFLVLLTQGISAFAVPWILGKGRVLFVSNLIYSRFSDSANFPSGSAISVTMIVFSLLLIFVVARLATRLDRT